MSLQVIECEYFDPNCLVGTNTGGSECHNGYYYSSADEICRSCSINYDPFCIKCDATEGFEGAWPR